MVIFRDAAEMIDDPLGKYCCYRLFEWVMTVALMGSGLTALIWPESIEVGNLRQMLLLVGADTIGSIYLTVGIVRSFCLVLNGNMPVWGPRVRAVMSVISALIWVQIAIALLLQLPVPSISISVYMSLAGGELISIYRARRDGHRA